MLYIIVAIHSIENSRGFAKWLVRRSLGGRSLSVAMPRSYCELLLSSATTRLDDVRGASCLEVHSSCRLAESYMGFGFF